MTRDHRCYAQFSPSCGPTIVARACGADTASLCAAPFRSTDQRDRADENSLKIIFGWTACIVVSAFAAIGETLRSI
jgi:hypothetical protein